MQSTLPRIDALLAGSPSRPPGPSTLRDVPAAARPVMPKIDPAVEAARRVLAEVAAGEVPANAAQVKAALAVVERFDATPARELDLTTPEGQEEVLRGLEALPTSLLAMVLERKRSVGQ